MPRKSKQDRITDEIVTAACQRALYRRKVDIMRLSAVFSEARAAYLGGIDADEAARAAVNRHAERGER